MSFGFSLGDIVLSYQLAFTVYDRCFTRAHGADIRYLQFGKQIKLLAESLRTLEAVISNADRQHQLPRRPWHNDADRFGSSVEVLPEVAGDFKKTLEDCDTLLKDHSKFRYSQANFVENVIWWSSVEGDVENLKERVRFHMMKLTFIAKPFEIQLLLGIKRELQLLRRDVDEIRTILIHGVESRDTSSATYLQSLQVPRELANRFTTALQNNKPPSLQDQANLPLKEGFDALVYHFANSTIEFNPRPELGERAPDEVQYLNLVKARWIAQMLRQSVFFQSAGPDSLWADYLKELEDDIRGQFRRFDTGQLVSPPPDRISLLPVSCFSIWVIEAPPVRPPDLAEQRPLEEKILDLALPGTYGTRQSALTIFRKSDSKLRLVTTTKDEQNQYFHQEEGTSVNLESERLIPTYANPNEASTATNNVMLCNNQGQDPIWYSLKDANDVLHFQRALTGFRVSHQVQNISWSIEGSSKPSKSGRGRLQFWHLKPFQTIGPDGERSSVDRSSISTRSPQSPTPSQSFARQSTGLSTTTTLFGNGSITSTVNGPSGDGTALVRPEIPRIVIFTFCDGMYTFLQFKIDSNLYIKATKFNTSVVVETKAKKIEFLKMSVSQLYSWNLACLRHPKHPEMRKLETVSKNSEATSKIMELVSKKYIVFNFSTPTDKDDFCREFNDLGNLRDTNQLEYNQALQDKKYQSNNPRKQQPPPRRPGSGISNFPPQFLRPPSSSISSYSPSTYAPSSYSPSRPSSIAASSYAPSMISAPEAPQAFELDGASKGIPELGGYEVNPIPEMSSYRIQ